MENPTLQIPYVHFYRAYFNIVFRHLENSGGCKSEGIVYRKSFFLNPNTLVATLQLAGWGVLWLAGDETGFSAVGQACLRGFRRLSSPCRVQEKVPVLHVPWRPVHCQVCRCQLSLQSGLAQRCHRRHSHALAVRLPSLHFLIASLQDRIRDSTAAVSFYSRPRLRF